TGGATITAAVQRVSRSVPIVFVNVTDPVGAGLVASLARPDLLGNLDATLAAANSTTGTVYPPGSVIQLIPSEAMVKRDKGFNTATHDWEFFELDVSKDGTQIRKQGTVDVVNRFGGNCFDCHVPAAAHWDLVCETDHGCAPLPVTRAMIRA